MNVWVILFNFFEQANEMIRNGIIFGSLRMVNVEFGMLEHGAKFCEDHGNREKFLVSNIVYQHV